jgi:hypothetical protein
MYHNLVPGPGRHVHNKILNIHVLLIHVSETYSTIMSLHTLGISVDVEVDMDNYTILQFINNHFTETFFDI